MRHNRAEEVAVAHELVELDEGPGLDCFETYFRQRVLDPRELLDAA
jgi:hypothetical protein